MFFKSGETNRKNLNFSEYQFKGNYNRCYNFPNSDFVRTSLNNNIQRLHPNLNFCSQVLSNQQQDEKI